MQSFRDNGGYDPASLKQASEWLIEAGRQTEAIDALRSVNLVQPLDTELHGKLGDLLLESGNAEDALLEYEIVLARKPHDMASAHFRVAQAHQRLGEPDLARNELLLALDIAPAYRPAQKLLLELSRSESDRQLNN
jgi:tetratricopeptide (TPR) repeat protein